MIDETKLRELIAQWREPSFSEDATAKGESCAESLEALMPEFAALVERARCFGEIGAVMSADGGHRLDEIGPTALLAQIEAKYYWLVKDAERLSIFEKPGHYGITLVSSDSGYWAVSDAGMQAVMTGEPEDGYVGSVVAADQWKPSVREAIDYYLANYEPPDYTAIDAELTP